MKVMHVVTTIANLNNVPIMDGQVIVLWDGDALYYDMNNSRHTVTNVKFVDQLPLVGEPNTIYVVNGTFYQYQINKWVLMNGIEDESASETTTYSSEKIEELLTEYILASEKHVPDGVAALDENGLVYEDQLPSYLRPIVVVDTYDELPETGDVEKVYLVNETNRFYRWDSEGEEYIELCLQLGHTSTTAYPGDEGYADHQAVQTLGDNIVSLALRVNTAENNITDLQASARSLQSQIDKIPINYLLNVEDITDLESALEMLDKPSYHNGDILALVNASKQMNVFIYDLTLEEWIPFSSGGGIQYDANNIYFTKDIICAGEYTQIGNIEKGLNETTTLPARGKSLAQVMDTIFTKELQPVKVNPSVDVILDQEDQIVECGEEVTVQYTATTSTGRYTYDQSTGVTISSLHIYDGISHTYDYTTPQGQFPALPVTAPQTAGSFDLYRTCLPIVGEVTYTAGAVAHTNLGNESDPVVQISAGSASDTSNVLGRRSLFYGVLPVDTEITSAAIRNLTNVINYEAQAGQTFTVDVSESGIEDPGSIIVAFPNEGPVDIHIASVIADGYFDPDVTSQYQLLDVVNVAGANGFTAVEYAVWGYQPDLLFSDDVHHITLG